MRNYVKIASASVIGNDGVFDQVLTFFGSFPAQAMSQAQLTADLLLQSGWTSANAIRNPDIYVLLNHSLLAAYLVFPQQGSQPAGGQAGQRLFLELQSISSQLGLDPFISPKDQDVRPWNGRKR